jgi:hypothetical protein
MAEKGRPTKYDSKYIDAVDEYLKTCNDEYKTVTVGSEVIKRLEVKLPMIEDFALQNDIPISTLYDWEKENPDFSVALDKIRSSQKRVLLNKGISGEYNSTIARLTLSANHNMKERNDLTTDDKPIQSNTIVIKRMNGNE